MAVAEDARGAQLHDAAALIAGAVRETPVLPPASCPGASALA